MNGGVPPQAANPGAAASREGRAGFCFVHVEFERPVSRLREDAKQAFSGYGSEIQGLGRCCCKSGCCHHTDGV